MEERRAAADTTGVNARRTFTLGLLVACVALAGRQGLIPGLSFARSARGGVNPIELSSAFAQAAGALAVYQHTAGTYDGAEVSSTSPVRIAWAANTSYCLEGGDGAGELHEVGPAGTPQPGPCPT